MQDRHYVEYAKLQIDRQLYDFVETEILPGLEIQSQDLWSGFHRLLTELAPQNKLLLEKRDVLQNQIDDWYTSLNGNIPTGEEQESFLRKIGYLVPEGDDFQITTENVDPEICDIAGPQLVVPVMNARYALNAANARWGSLYDALYGTNVIAGDFDAGEYNPARGAQVIAYASKFLDQVLPLCQGSHQDIVGYELHKQNEQISLVMTLQQGQETTLLQAEKFIGYRVSETETVFLFQNNKLHIEIVQNTNHPVGQHHPAGVCDVILEAALTTIQDCEDSVAAVDVEDKIAVYRNWLGLMKGNLQTSFQKTGQQVKRALAPDRLYQGCDGRSICLSGRSLLLVRNVGHLMMSDAVHDSHGQPIPEGFLDALITGLIAKHDMAKTTDQVRNSKTGSLYIVKPKMHGPEEVAFANELFNAVEDILQMPRYAIKIGVMDEERRTSVNLKECIRAVQHRLVFINTGFLDRTGDEIHTAFQAGAMLRKDDMKTQPWLTAYENWNVDIGLRCGLGGKAQIGKGMWAMPDEMAQMMVQKTGHLDAGANCAWVPSPTAAILHAIHYHKIDVFARQKEIQQRQIARLTDILTLPILSEELTKHDIQQELDNNVQGILGYVVRWINSGIGCSKVPNIHNVGLMEDRATLRISAQHIANWLHHGICEKEQVMATLRRMAQIVDDQNKSETEYAPMATDFENSLAFEAACDLIFKGAKQPSGYTEPILHHMRLVAKGRGMR